MQILIAKITYTGGSDSLLGFQLCDSSRDADHIFGVAMSDGATFTEVQAAVAGWNNATCLQDLTESTKIPGQASLISSLLVPATNGTFDQLNATRTSSLRIRGDCRAIQVVVEDGCASLGSKCGVSGNTFMSYNPRNNLFLVAAKLVCVLFFWLASRYETEAELEWFLRHLHDYIWRQLLFHCRLPWSLCERSRGF